MERISLASIIEIEKALLSHETGVAYVFPETICDIIYHPAFQHGNGTPLYHIMSEPFSKLIKNLEPNLTLNVSEGVSPQFVIMYPKMWQAPFFDLWNRLEGSGIDMHLKRQTVRLYKMMRLEWLDSVKSTKMSNSVEDESIGSDLWLLLFVLGFGYILASLCFLVEHLFCIRKGVVY